MGPFPAWCALVCASWRSVSLLAASEAQSRSGEGVPCSLWHGVGAGAGAGPQKRATLSSRGGVELVRRREPHSAQQGWGGAGLQ